MLFSNFLLLLVILPCVWSDDGPFVKTPLGWIIGHYGVSSLGKKYDAFEGIPYAQPPVGNLRFEPPQKLISWIGNYSATIPSPSCIGFGLNPFTELLGVEDCLYLNVYRPALRPERSLSTIVWIHPGPLHFKPFGRYGPEFLMNREIIYVEINFRLGPFGFLSTEDDIVSGNMGMKDQVMALKWISENIEYFGGDPNKVTLTGGSGGGVCVHYHMLSPMSAGLFQRAISLAGSALSLALQTPNPLKNAKILAESVGCLNRNKLQMVTCLKLKSAKSLAQAFSIFTFWTDLMFYSPFSIVVEKGNKEHFLDRSPIDIMERGDVHDVPWLLSYNGAGDGMFPVGTFFSNKTLMNSLNNNWEDIIFPLLKMDEAVPENLKPEVAKKIKKHYFGSKSVSTETKDVLEQLSGDAIIRTNIERSIRLMTKVMHNSVWMYRFRYKTAGSYCNSITSTNYTEPCHLDDTLLVLRTPEVLSKATSISDLRMQSDLLDLWISIADEGTPKISNKSWKPISPTDEFLSYLVIDSPGIYNTSFSINFSNNHFWSSLPIKKSLI